MLVCFLQVNLGDQLDVQAKTSPSLFVYEKAESLSEGRPDYRPPEGYTGSPTMQRGRQGWQPWCVFRMCLATSLTVSLSLDARPHSDASRSPLRHRHRVVHVQKLEEGQLRHWRGLKRQVLHWLLLRCRLRWPTCR